MTAGFTTDLLVGALRTLPALAVAFFFTWLLWRVLAASGPAPAPGERLVRTPAVLVQRLALVTAEVLGLLGVLPDVDPSRPWASLGLVLVEGSWVTVAVLSARAIVDWLLFPRVANLTLIADGNLAVALAEAGFYVGLGFVLWGSLTGGSPDPLTGVLATTVFFVLGVLFVIALFWLREWVTPYSLRDRLAAGDLAAATDLAGTLAGTSAVVAVACSGDFVSWGTSLAWFAGTAVVSVALLHLFRVGARFAVLGRSIRSVHDDRDVVAASVLGVVMLLSGLVVAVTTLTVL